MSKNNIRPLSEETRVKMLKIFKWFIPSMIILNIFFIVFIATYQGNKDFFNILFYIIDFSTLGLVTLKLYKLDKKDKKT